MQLRYQHVCVEAVTHTLPAEIVTSAEIEARLEPLYRRLRLPEGRLELMTGIRERRFWPAGMLPSEQSVPTGEKALVQAAVDRGLLGALVHGSVCRDYLEPATASGVHQRLGLASDCLVFNVSNACLGLLNGVLLVAGMIELGQIEAGLVVGTESGRALVETTIDRLNRDTSLTRQETKLAFASLTIGSGSAAILLVHCRRSRRGLRLVGAAAGAFTDHCRLCQSGRDETVGDAMRPLMWTDSEALLNEGVAAAGRTFHDFLAATGWQREQIRKVFCHQVGRAHQKLLLESLQLDPALDFPTYPYLGNTGAVALPTATSLGLEQGHVQPGDRVALLGIGSGINVLMLGLEQTVV